jgi:AraC-like DNA-binding protein
MQDPRFKHLTISEIGRRVGYLDPSHFARVVKRETTETPLKIRQTLLKK